MIDKFQDSPVIYVVVKLIFSESIGNYSNEKYKVLLSDLSSIGFASYIISNIMGVQLKQSDNQLIASNANFERVAYFTANKSRCVIIDQNSIELRLTEYGDYNDFFDDFETLIDIFSKHEMTIKNNPREIELHYVDLFIPKKNMAVKNLFSTKVSFPSSQFYTDDEELMQIGMTSLTRILASGKSKVTISLEHFKTKGTSIQKWLPDVLIEPDERLAMPLNINKLHPAINIDEYVIVHTACGTLFDIENTLSLDTKKMLSDIRAKLNAQYNETKKTFNALINQDILAKASKN